MEPLTSTMEPLTSNTEPLASTMKPLTSTTEPLTSTVGTSFRQAYTDAKPFRATHGKQAKKRANKLMQQMRGRGFDYAIPEGDSSARVYRVVKPPD
eukprot:2336384-Pyramimonas_sp.AAC.1